tara:strand:+ start:626 stop:994 length:369 start_codon:yes stop_codon:yes gene_type:complete
MVWFLPGLLLLLVVSVGSISFISGLVITGVDFMDKVVHTFSYFVLMVWFSGLYTNERNAIVGLLLIILGITLEYIQTFLPYRFFDPLDLIANTVGVILGLALAFFTLGGWCQRVERLLGYQD